MNNEISLHYIGLVSIAAVSAALIFWAVQGSVFPAQKTEDIVLSTKSTTVAVDRLVRVILASPYGR